MLFLIGILYVGAISTGPTYGARNFNWFAAQQECEGKGQMLIKNQSSIPMIKNRDYWIGQYKDLSGWIHILGCYNASDVLPQKEKEIHMEIPSPGLCQVNCISRGIYYFGIQNNICLCLKQRINGDKQLSSRCHFTCNSEQDDKFSTECGGHSSYNVFFTGEMNDPQDVLNLCMVLQCSQKDKKFLTKSCGEDIARLCESPVSDMIYQRNWTASMDVCTNNSKSYLVGDINVSSIDAVCNTIANRLFSIRWIGIAKQWFINFDRGQTISKEKQNIIELCKTCNQQECGMQQCNTTLQTEVLCIPIPTTNITKATTSSTTRSTTRSTTSSTTKQTATTKVTTSAATNVAINTTKDSHVNRNSNQQDSNEHSVLVGILVTVMVLIVAGVVIGIIILKRRQAKIPKNVRKAGLKNELPEIQQNKNYNESDNSMNNNYFVLESPKSNYEVLDDDIQESESPYIDGGEGTYDHLRDKESRRKTTDNVYQHAHCLQNKESSDYDFAGRAGNQEIENPYYDHANEHTRNSDYGYNTLDRS